jgi:hypothetical protein
MGVLRLAKQTRGSFGQTATSMRTNVPLYMLSLVLVYVNNRIDGRKTPPRAEGEFDGGIDIGRGIQINDWFSTYLINRKINRITIPPDDLIVSSACTKQFTNATFSRRLEKYSGLGR